MYRKGVGVSCPLRPSNWHVPGRTNIFIYPLVVLSLIGAVTGSKTSCSISQYCLGFLACWPFCSSVHSQVEKSTSKEWNSNGSLPILVIIMTERCDGEILNYWPLGSIPNLNNICPSPVTHTHPRTLWACPDSFLHSIYCLDRLYICSYLVIIYILLLKL